MDEGDGFRRRVWGKNNSGGMSDPSVVLFGGKCISHQWQWLKTVTFPIY